ncbi:MAG: twin-arginine translocation signal domain-containing protein [Gammaproteobacteria bacterium]|jgi:diketogulonate reductase-like aldo/keto reductase|nr:twin-arginine translocation signal domain-containing protein [Gammaproteobacteria bacterium]
MTNRRDFLKSTGAAALGAAMPAIAFGHDKLEIHSRPIPGTGEELPMVGLGNSRIFQEGDLEATRKLIELFLSYGGSYIDTLGPSRFTVASVMQAHELQSRLFVGTYLGTVQYDAMVEELERVRKAQGKEVLDLVLTYDFNEILAEPERYVRLKEEGLIRYLGVARHKLEFHEPMMRLMDMGIVDFVQVNYSLLEPEAGETVLPMAQEKNVAILVNRAFTNGDYFDVVRDRELPEWAAEIDCESWAQFSLKFILSHPAVTCVLTETANPDHLVDNMAAGMGRLPDQSMRQKMLELVQSFV